MQKHPPHPPHTATRLLSRLLRDELQEEVLGDLEEQFATVSRKKSLLRARLNYWYQTFHYCRPFAIRRPKYQSLKKINMYGNYFKIGFRKLKRNKVYSFLNIGGLSVGLTVVMLIGLWMHDELTYNHYHLHHDQIARVMQHINRDGGKITARPLPFPMGNELREVYGDNFKTVIMSSWTWNHLLGNKTHGILRSGAYMEPDAPQLLSLNVVRGDLNGLREQHSILLSESTATALFSEQEPIGQAIQIDNGLRVVVTGVYEDIPQNSSFNDLNFIAPWELYVNNTEWVKQLKDDWDNYGFTAFVEIADGLQMNVVTDRIRPAISRHTEEFDESAKNEVFLHAMNDWHLRDNWVNGQQSGGAIQYVWLFGGIGLFVLTLACINFMNLSTAQSLNRSKEVGIRKAIGSVRKQLIDQFLSESFVLVLCSFTVSLLLLWACLPYFSQLSGKQLVVPFFEPWFGLSLVAMIITTSLLAGSYPAFYLSGFQAIRALKGSVIHRNASTGLRKGLVVVQFVISVALIVGTLAVRDQIQYAQNRPMGYHANNLIAVHMVSSEYYGKFDFLDNKLKNSRTIQSMAMTSSPMNRLNSTIGGFHWEGMDPDFHPHLGVVWAHPDLGKTIGWEILQGRDFSKDLVTDSASFILNEAAVSYLNLKDPIGEKITLDDYGTFKIIGITKDIIRESPYEPIKPMIYLLDPQENELEYFLLKLNPELSATDALADVEKAFHEITPNIPFEYEFVDEQYARKFKAEVRVGSLAGVFAGLAIFISCLGLFGLASYMAEQRTKEIGIRKVLGATIFHLWQLLSLEFLGLVIISCFIAIPLAYYYLQEWLSHYTYRITPPWYSFLLAIAIALLITLLTVSFQSLKAALSNPVKSLRTE